MNIFNNKTTRIFAKEGQYGTMYSLGISEQQQDNTYLTVYLPVQFRKDVVIEDKTDIIIKSGWIKPTKDLKIKLFVNEFEIASNDNFKDFDGNVQTIDNDDDLPF